MRGFSMLRHERERCSGRRYSSLFVREAAKKDLARRHLDKMEDGKSEEDQDHVREPWIQRGEVKALGDVIDVQELEDIEVEQVEAVTALTDQEQWAPGEESGDGMGAT